MGLLFSSLWAYLFPGSKEYKIVMVGLDNAGKTSILYQLHLGQAVVTQPTVGCNVEQIQHNNLTFEVWDLGGQANLRPSWATYYKHTDAVIVVVDSTDRARMNIAKNELFSLLDHEHLQSAAILVFANKQDLKDAMAVGDLTQTLNLHSIKKHDWHIQACCALTGEGLVDGLEWISQRVKGGAGSSEAPGPAGSPVQTAVSATSAVPAPSTPVPVSKPAATPA
eukprot:jgi/Botrbrau1/3564/Bobra.0078s0021.1